VNVKEDDEWNIGTCSESLTNTANTETNEKFSELLTEPNIDSELLTEPNIDSELLTESNIEKFHWSDTSTDSWKNKPTNFCELAFANKTSSYEAQALFPTLSSEEKKEIYLKFPFEKAFTHAHANFVVQAMIVEDSDGVFPFLKLSQKIAKHCTGCRILCRLVETAGQEAEAFLVKLLQDHGCELSRSDYGCYVVECCINSGTEWIQKTVLDTLTLNLKTISRSRKGWWLLRLARKIPGGESLADLL
jgi:hypothetical protein